MSSRTFLIVVLAGIAWSCVLGLQRPPPRYSQQYMPDTSFSCRSKIVGSYYADPETDCQLFHVCVSVAGSIQDYKFLCPNDTAFDQESQTCADWYDVDCEAATLYYASDNFDLYRLGSGLESLHYDSVRSDAEPQDNLQRSETSDAVRSSTNYNQANENNNANSRDILRGSSSINFYNSRNGGKDEDYDNEKVYREEVIQEPRKKSGVRKVARKQPQNNNNNNNANNVGNNYAASSTVAPVIASSPSTSTYNGGFYNNNNNNYNNKNYNRQRTSTFPSSTTASPPTNENYNVRGQNTQKYNAPTTTYRPSTSQQTYSTYQASSTTARTTAYNNNNNYNNNNAYNTNNNQQTSNSYGQSIVTSPKTTSYSQNYPAVTTPRSTSYNQNNQEQQTYNEQFSQFGQNTRVQSSTVQPSANYQSGDYTNYQRNYNNIQRTTSSPNTFPTTLAPTTYYNGYNTNNGQYNANNGQYNTNNGQYNANNNNNNKAQSSTRQATQTTKYFPNYTVSSYVPTTYSPATKKAVINDNARSADRGHTPSNNGQYNNQQQSLKTGQFYDSTRTSKKPVANDDITDPIRGRGADRYDSQATGNDNGQYNGPQQLTKSSQYHDSTRAPKKATQYNGNYDITNNGKYYESSTINYDIGRSQTGIGFSPSSINLLAETPRTTTPAPKRNAAPTTYNPISFNANNQRQTQTTPRATTLVSGSARPFSTTTRLNDATTPRPKSGKKNDYDYAYYDNTGGLEYDGLDLEHVVAGNKESSKISRN